MKKSLITLSLTLLFGSAALLHAPNAAAGNRDVEVTLQSYGDLSMFYQALINTGVINELNENTRYTIFAPTNAAFASVQPRAYPCFYAEQCRPQIAGLLRNHILTDRYDLRELVTYGQGIQTGGIHRVHVVEPYVDDYTVDGLRILSASEVGGNIIYRIDGVIASPQELAQFQTVSLHPVPSTVTTEKTVTRKTYVPSTVYPVEDSANTTETTTVIRRYTP
ncbi:MAG: fasciclin domain-containing protein [Alphaproteobacteria bacterium]|nr:fasciclin domain-containing protein [Alphaproteobacteria bacterium]